jgi:tyrosine-protein phosphatase SIW14
MMKYRLSEPGSRRIAGIALAALLIVTGTAVCGTKARPEKWAKPVASSVLKNWYKLDDDVYRSRQPDRKGFEEAKRAGIRTIVNLRANHSDAKLIEGLGLNLVEIPMEAWAFSEDQIIAALRAIQDSPKPVLVHCQHGSDRVGVVSAAYRVLFSGWTGEEAIDELKHGGFGFHWYYTNIPAFIRKMDVARMRSRLSAPIPVGRAPAALLDLP